MKTARLSGDGDLGGIQVINDILENEWTIEKGSTTKTIKIGHLAAGVYNLMVYVGDEMHVLSFTKI